MAGGEYYYLPTHFYEAIDAPSLYVWTVYFRKKLGMGMYLEFEISDASNVLTEQPKIAP